VSESSAARVVEVLARALVDRPDEVRVEVSEHRGRTVVELFLAPGDAGRVIGRQGRTIAAIRTLAASAGEKDGQTIAVEVRDAPRRT
jgi:predicted RNA-binding protein YlqC (UPF0109 family)